MKRRSDPEQQREDARHGLETANYSSPGGKTTHHYVLTEQPMPVQPVVMECGRHASEQRKVAEQPQTSALVSKVIPKPMDVAMRDVPATVATGAKDLSVDFGPRPQCLRSGVET
jgi:hypothetical protein